MYLYAWKAGLKTTYYLRSRPATRIQQATVAVAAGDRPTDRRRRRGTRLLAREPRDLRGLPVTTTAPTTDDDPDAARPGHGPDPAADALPALLRALPRRHQEHLDRRGGRPALRPRRPAAAHRGRAAPGRPAGRVLRHRRHDRRQQPGAQPLPAHQLARGPALPVAAAVRGGRARPVLPDPARHLRARRDRAARGVRRGREHPVDQAPRPSSASGGSTRSSSCDELRDPGATGGRSCST